jgi:hypothetical protein
MYYVYILKLRNGQHYVGFTRDCFDLPLFQDTVEFYTMDFKEIRAMLAEMIGFLWSLFIAAFIVATIFGMIF